MRPERLRYRDSSHTPARWTCKPGRPRISDNIFVAENRKRKKQMRGKSMLGTILFALGIVLLVSSVITGSVWIGVAAAACLIPGVLMLYQVGKSVS